MTDPKHAYDTDSAESDEKLHTILLYSPDMDLCMSLRMLYQDRYAVRTTTDSQMFALMVSEFSPDLVIIDGLPRQRMKEWLERIRSGNPRVRIMFFYAQRFDDRTPKYETFGSADAAFSKPVDLAEVTERIHELVEEEE